VQRQTVVQPLSFALTQPLLGFVQMVALMQDSLNVPNWMMNLVTCSTMWLCEMLVSMLKLLHPSINWLIVALTILNLPFQMEAALVYDDGIYYQCVYDTINCSLARH
jgi:hypothetical protein